MASPAINPTGLSDGMATTNWAAMPTGGPGNYNFGNATNPNPPGPAMPGVKPQAWGMTPGGSTGAPAMPGGGAAPGGSTGNPIGTVPGAPPAPTTGASPLGPGGAAPGIAGFNTQEQTALQSSLAGTFHTGYGTYLEQLLNSQGGYNSQLTQQNVDATIAAMQTNINKGYGTLQTELGQQGVSPNSSTAALENSMYMSDATTQENAIAAQDYFNMWNASQGREFSLAQSIEGPMASEKASESWQNTLGAIGGFIGDLSGIGYSSSSGGGSSGSSSSSFSL
jgi:hypothetical protein